MTTRYTNADAALRRAIALVAEGDFAEAKVMVEGALLFYLTHECNSPATARLSAMFKQLQELASDG